MADVKFVTLGCAAEAIARSAIAAYWTHEEFGGSGHHGETIRRKFEELCEAIEPDTTFTYLVQTEGYYRETPIGTTRETVIEDIATGQYDAARVFYQTGGRFEDVSEAIAGGVYSFLEKRGRGRNGFIPEFLTIHSPDDADDLRNAWMTPEERRADAIEARADELRDERRERMLEAAE